MSKITAKFCMRPIVRHPERSEGFGRELQPNGSRVLSGKILRLQLRLTTALAEAANSPAGGGRGVRARTGCAASRRRPRVCKILAGVGDARGPMRLLLGHLPFDRGELFVDLLAGVRQGVRWRVGRWRGQRRVPSASATAGPKIRPQRAGWFVERAAERDAGCQRIDASERFGERLAIGTWAKSLPAAGVIRTFCCTI